MCRSRVAVVTGAARGLGLAFANALRAAGVIVVTCDRRDGCDAVVDVRDAAALHEWVAVVERDVGPIDLAIANAGVTGSTRPVDSLEQSVADFDEMIGTNLAGTFHLGRAVAPFMVQRGRGHIVIIGTDHLGRPDGQPTGSGGRMDVYDASKWALRGLLEAWATALGRDGVRVNMLNMGATDTPMLREHLGDRVTDEMAATWIRPEQIAQVLVDLDAEGPTGRTGAMIGLWPGHPIVLPAR